MALAANVLRLWLNSSVYETNAPFYVEGFKMLGEELKVDIELRTIPWSKASDSLITAFKNGNPPDVFQLGTTFIRTFAHLDYLAPVPDDLKLRPPLAGWIDGCCSYKGNGVAVPWVAEAMLMAARRDVMDRYDIKTADIADWDGFYRVCCMIADDCKKKKNGNTLSFPLLFPIRPENKTLRSYISWFLSGGWKFPPLTGIPANILKHEAVARTLKYIFGLIRAEGIGIKDVRIHPSHLFEQFVSQGRYAFSVEYWGGDIANAIRQPGLFGGQEIELAIMPIPSVSGESAGWGGGSALSVSSVTKYPEAAWKLVEYMCSDGFIDQWSLNSGDLPAFQSAFWDRNSRSGHLKVVYDQIKKSRSYPSHPLWLTIEKYMCEDVANLLWRMINSKATYPDDDIYSELEKMDHRIIDSLKMAWELDNEV